MPESNLGDGGQSSADVDLRRSTAKLGVWEREGERAPHKPLLILLVLGHYAAGGPRLIPYARLDKELSPLLEEFGPPRRTIHTEYPFWYLTNDGFWEVVGADEAPVRKGKASQPTKGGLLKHGAVGGFTVDAHEAVASDPHLVRDLAFDLLSAHFASTLHEEILDRVGLYVGPGGPLARDPDFRPNVIFAYESRCALCGHASRLNDRLVSLDAAHIRWHEAGGPSDVENGLALCVLHHRLFDRGAFTLTAGREVEVSRRFIEGAPSPQGLLGFHGRPIALPSDRRQAPNVRYIEWHREQVFCAPGRQMS